MSALQNNFVLSFASKMISIKLIQGYSSMKIVGSRLIWYLLVLFDPNHTKNGFEEDFVWIYCFAFHFFVNFEQLMEINYKAR